MHRFMPLSKATCLVRVLKFLRGLPLTLVNSTGSGETLVNSKGSGETLVNSTGSGETLVNSTGSAEDAQARRNL